MFFLSHCLRVFLVFGCCSNWNSCQLLPPDSDTTTFMATAVLDSTEDPMQTDESNRNYLKQFVETHSGKFGYNEGLTIPFDQELISKLANAASEPHPSEPSNEAPKEDDDSHYSPNYGETSDYYGTHKSGSGHRSGGKHRSKARQEDQHETPLVDFRLPQTGKSSNYYNQYGKSRGCKCECPSGRKGGHMVHRRSYYHNEGGDDEEAKEKDNEMEGQVKEGDNEDQMSNGDTEPAIACSFSETDCDFKNDDYDDSLFRYGYNVRFGEKLWFIDNSRQHKYMGKYQGKGWGRLVTPYYEVPKYTSHDACMLVEFDFDSEGTDHLVVHVQENDNTRIVLDYLHERPSEKEALLLKKYVHFVVTGTSIRFFIQLTFDTKLPDSAYVFRTFQLFFSKCPKSEKPGNEVMIPMFASPYYQ